MQRTQISLTAEDRRLLDAAAARTGLSLSRLIRDAVNQTYGAGRDADDDIAAIASASGAWVGRDVDGAGYVETLRSGSRLREQA
ncbi:ribbon-helix-helix protein, CopG family [Serinicoccus marinus]|uniref:ribbon-helix-helix protein, CopG family n=1 Tax=Serinicoccus marinus TaxID=247333 RepID=UPI0003B6F7BB|nr:ribbon-helix-helix protein, CopG family [Serinicoccus marinus]